MVTSSPSLYLAGCLEDCVLVTVFIGTLALPLHRLLDWYAGDPSL